MTEGPGAERLTEGKSELGVLSNTCGAGGRQPLAGDRWPI